MKKVEIFCLVCGFSGILVLIYPAIISIRRRLFRNKVMKLKFELLKKISKQFSKENRGVLWRHQKTVEFCEHVRLNIPNYYEYLGYHLLAGSTPSLEESPKLDLPKPYSAVNFLKKTISDAIEDEDVKIVTLA